MVELSCVVVWTDNLCVFFLMIRRPPRSTQSRSSAASDVYKRQLEDRFLKLGRHAERADALHVGMATDRQQAGMLAALSLIHISEPTRPY